MAFVVALHLTLVGEEHERQRWLVVAHVLGTHVAVAETRAAFLAVFQTLVTGVSG